MRRKKNDNSDEDEVRKIRKAKENSRPTEERKRKVGSKKR